MFAGLGFVFLRKMCFRVGLLERPSWLTAEMDGWSEKEWWSFAVGCEFDSEKMGVGLGVGC